MNFNARLLELPAFVPDKRNAVYAIVDTPQGSRNKFKFNSETGLFELGGVMPAGAMFPFEFGFIPSTLGGDGDHLDLLILLDAPTFVGCVVRVRLIGVIVAEQTERSGEVERNDRLIAVAEKSRRHEPVRALRQLPKALVREIEHFFVSYNEVKGKRFNPCGRFGPARALKLVREGIARAETAARNG
jgi:inorganic pyrophosphatase